MLNFLCLFSICEASDSTEAGNVTGSVEPFYIDIVKPRLGFHVPDGFPEVTQLRSRAIQKNVI